MKIESFQVYHLSEKARVIIKQGSRGVTILKKINPVTEAQIRLNADELSQLFHVAGLRTLTEEALKTFDKGDDHASE